MDAFGPTSAVVAEFFERLRRNRVLARNVFSTRGHRGCLRRSNGKHWLNGVRTSGTGSRTDVWRSCEGRKGIWRAARTVRGRALRGARNITADYAGSLQSHSTILSLRCYLDRLTTSPLKNKLPE